MDRDALTTQYARLFDKRRPKIGLRFLRDVYASGKIIELSSFIVWELCHKLHLFRNARYLQFTRADALNLDGEPLSNPDFRQKMDAFFADKGLRVADPADNWKLLFIDRNGTAFGCAYPHDHVLSRSVDRARPAVSMAALPQRIKSLFVSSEGTVFVCVKGALYRSSAAGESPTKVLDLSTSESFFRHNNAMTQTSSGTLILGEYGNVWENAGWKKIAYLYFSADDGHTWTRSDFLIARGANKHVHVVKYCELLDRILVTDGDNYKRLWIGDALGSCDVARPQWRLVNRFHLQMGGYFSVVENGGKVLLGTDYQGGTNFLVETTDGRQFTRQIVPDPYRKSPVDNMVLRKSRSGIEIWASLPFSTGNSRCLLMYSSDNGRTWNKVFEYSRATHIIRLISASSEPTDETYLSIEQPATNGRIVCSIGDA